MDVLFFNLDTSCNRACGYCFYNTGHLPRRETLLGESDWIAAVDEAVEMRVKGIIFTGGEPLLGGEVRLGMIERLVRRAREGGIYTLLLTNGDFFSRRAARRLANAGLGGISISQDTLTGIEGYKVRGWKAVESALAEDLSVTIIMTITSENYVDLPPIYRYAAVRRLGLILQPAFIPEDSPQFERLSLHELPREELMNLFADIKKWSEPFGLQNYYSYLKSLFDMPGGAKPDHCDMGSRVCVIEPDGAVAACFHRPDVVAGDLRKNRLRGIVAKLGDISRPLSDAHCFGEHCVSLFTES